MFACIHQWDKAPALSISKIAADFSPAFEQPSANSVVFEIDSLRKLYPSPHHIAQAIAQRAGEQANVAIAATVDSAILAARYCRGVSVLPDLSPLPVGCLPLTDEMSDVFERWGIHTLEDLAKLPETGIAERFGKDGVYLQRLARGTVNRPLKIHQSEITYDDRIELDHPVSLLEPLSFLIARILNEQCEKLQSHAMATNEIHLILELEDKTKHRRTLRLPVAMRQSKPLLKLLQMDLEAHPPQAPVLAVALILKPVPPRTIQHGIFLPVTPAPDKLELTLARIRGLVGEENVGIPELLDTHHPHPFRLAWHRHSCLVGSYSARQKPTQARTLVPHAFRYFRPALAAKVEILEEQPARIVASGVAGKIAVAAGPWRTSGDWWTNTAWNRDEWDVALANGVVYRIYREPDRGWFVEGSYD